MFAKVQYHTINTSNPVFTVPADRTIKIVKFHLNKLDTGADASNDSVKIYIADTGAAIWEDFTDEFNTGENGGGASSGHILNNLFPITLAAGQMMKVIAGSAVSDCQCWISYEEYSEDATVTSASGFTVS